MLHVNIAIHLFQVNAKVVGVKVNQVHAHITVVKTQAVYLKILHIPVIEGPRFFATEGKKDEGKTKKIAHTDIYTQNTKECFWV